MIKIKNKKLLLTICSALIVSTGATGVTLSSFTSKDEVVNNFEVGNIDIDNKEPGFNPGTYEDGTIIPKNVTIKNETDGNPALVRVNITPRWVDESGNPWSGDASEKIVTLNFINPGTEEEEKKEKEEFDKNWLKGNDGYYYYRYTLQPKDETYPILKSVKITLKGEDGKYLVENPEYYKGKKLIVDVNSEAIQPTKQAYMDAWGIEDKPIDEEGDIERLLEELVGR